MHSSQINKAFDINRVQLTVRIKRIDCWYLTTNNQIQIILSGPRL